MVETINQKGKRHCRNLAIFAGQAFNMENSILFTTRWHFLKQPLKRRLKRRLAEATARLGLALYLFVSLAAPAHAFGIRDAEIEELMRDYSKPLFIAAGLNPDDIGLTLINNRGLNAFVAMGQNIFVNTGLLLESDEPNMVIGVLAHEIGHITGGHLARNMDAMSRAQAPTLVTTILGFGSLIAGNPEAGMALLAGGQQVAERTYLTHSRAQEASADVTALQLLEATEQSPNGIIDLMDSLAAQEIVSEVHQDPYARSHPMSRDRFNAYLAGAAKSPYAKKRDNPELVARHRMAQAKIIGFMDPPESTFRQYPNNDSKPALYARAIAFHRQAQINEAIELIDVLIALEPDNPYFHELKGQIYYESGRPAKGLAPYQRALALKPNEPLLMIGLAMCQVETGTNGGDINHQAIENLRAALRLDPENHSAYRQLFKAYGQIDQVAYAQWALAEYHALLRSPAAVKHAKRAMRGLPKTSAEFLRARDIVATSF